MEARELLSSQPHACALAEGNPSGTMAKAMQRLGTVSLQPMPGESKFVKPESVIYEMDGDP